MKPTSTGVSTATCRLLFLFAGKHLHHSDVRAIYERGYLIRYFWRQWFILVLHSTQMEVHKELSMCNAKTLQSSKRNTDH